jgi:hypothetical protein
MYMRVWVCICMYKHVLVGICRYLFLFSAVHKKWCRCGAGSYCAEIDSAKEIPITAKRLWLFWGSNTRGQVHYWHYVPLSQPGWQHQGNDGLYTTCNQVHTYIYLQIPVYTYIYMHIPTYTCTYMHIHAQLGSTRTPKICFWFRRARVRLAQCSR